MRKIIVLILMMALLVCMVQPAFAGQPIFETLHNDQVAELNMNNEWNKMRAKPEQIHGQPAQPFQKVEYYVKSTGAMGGIRYRTTHITFKVGEYGPAIFGANLLRSKTPNPGETIHDKVTLDRDFFEMILGSASGENGPALVNQALDTEAIMKVGAIIELYNANTGQVLMVISKRDSGYPTDEDARKALIKAEYPADTPLRTCDEAASKGFLPPDISDMKSRWQEVLLRPVQPPDFFPTPEGSNQWQSSYADPNTCAKTYEAEPGQTINIPVILYNSGVSG